MTIPSLTAVGGTAQTFLQKTTAQMQAAIASIISGAPSGYGDVASISTTAAQQPDTTWLWQLSGNLAQSSSMTQVAAGGVTQIQDILGQLQSLAQQATSPGQNADTLQALNQQFQQLSSQIDSTAGTTTSFGGQNLLDGSVSSNNALSLDNLLGTDSGSVSIGNLSSASLFSGQSLNLLSADNANQALGVIGSALSQVTGVGANLGAYQQTINYAVANVESAIANQEAANSTLQESDLAGAATQNISANIQQNADIALAAQGNNLNPALMQLIG